MRWWVQALYGVVQVTSGIGTLLLCPLGLAHNWDLRFSSWLLRNNRRLFT